jgi:GH15 family glucan-1,4-alpha-glucosidase
MYPFGLIGNCQASALVSKYGTIEWLCLPRPDSPPVFGKILGPEGGEFAIGQLTPSNVLHTRTEIEDGSSFQITDFCPRFEQHGRIYRPLAIFRIVEPIDGSPSIRVSCKPVTDGIARRSSPSVEAATSGLEFERPRCG